MDKLKIKWSPRLSLNKMRQLYLSHASGLLNEELLEDVAITLYLRCKDILAVNKAKGGEIRCPFCYEKAIEIYIPVTTDEHGKKIDNLLCPECSGTFSFIEYKRCSKRVQLNMGGAEEAFRRFVREYERPASPEKRMLQVDRLIHEFHYSLRSDLEQPTRSVGPNLLDAKLTDVMTFLNELSGLVNDLPELKNSADNWLKKRKNLNEFWGWDN